MGKSSQAHRHSGSMSHDTRNPGHTPAVKGFFFSQANLKRHRCNVHDETKSHVCEQCGAAFAVNADLNRHKRRHANSFKYTCDTCQMKFETRAALKDHIDKHNNEFQHRCDECDKTFRYRSNLRRHIRMTHEGQ